MVCPHGQGGEEDWSSADILRTKERETIFRDHVRTYFMDGPIIFFVRKNSYCYFSVFFSFFFDYFIFVFS